MRSPPRRTLVVGVTGAPAAGKSTVTGMLAGLGAVVVDADRLAHEALALPRIARRVERALGGTIRGADGAVDRKAVADRVFRSSRALRRLTSILHPVVLRGMRGAVAAARRSRAAAVVLDVPLLFESGADRDCDVTVFVDAPRRVRLARARARGWTAAELARREARQAPAAERRRRACWTVDNGGSRSATRRQVRALWTAALAGDVGSRTRRT